MRRYSLRLPIWAPRNYLSCVAHISVGFIVFLLILYIPDLPCYTREADSVNPPLCCYVRGRFSGYYSHYERYKLLFSGRSSQQAQENYEEEEINGYDNCCGRGLTFGQRSYFCSWYSRRRPRATSRGYRTRRTSFGFGDPHFTTLDNEQYTFNGHGEYILVVQPGQFMMQGRAEPALNVNGTEIKATFFTAIAAKNLATGDTVRFHPNAAGNDTVININGNITTLPVIDELETSSQLRYRRTSATNYEFVFSPDVTLVIFTIKGVVGFGVKLSDNLKQASRGLLNPVEYRNGTAINITTLRIKDHSQLLDGTVDQEKIFPFGQSWHVKMNESLFEYTPSRNFSYYNRPQKVPEFLRSLVDNLDNATRTSIISTCGIKALACVFDLALTGNQELAKASEMIAEESEMLHRLAVNNAPEIYYDKDQGANFVNGTIRAVVGTNFTVQFKANDSDGNPLLFSVNNDEIPGVSIDSSGFLTFVVTSANNMAINSTLTISVNDSLTDDNEEINVLVCNCNSRGSCQWTDTLRGGSENYGLVPCDCTEAYDGAECMDDADGCSDDPCFTNCTDVPAPGLGYTCDPCPAHLTGNGTNCLDRDECEEGVDDCAQNCTNVVNSFNCSCRAGFMVDSSNSSNCVNVNECMMNPPVCAAGGSAAACLDTEGSYMCACRPGYKMDGAGVCVDIPDCNNRTICDNTTSVCQETPGSYRCDCKMGYSRRPGSSSKSSCVNTNECTGAKPVCSSGSRCVDSEGSFSCICLPGYIRKSREVCTPNVTSCANINCTAERSVCQENGRSPVTCVCRGSRVQRSNKCLPKYKFQQRMRDNFRSEYNNLNNALTRAFISRFKANMLLMLTGKNVSEILVTKLMSGSVIVLYELILNEAQGSPVLSQQDVLVTISQAISSGQFNTSLFDGSPTTCM
ncbi:mucin-like protein [Ciona intestinalis]